ncbi:MAG: hypothetical protein C4326_07095 [Ignavibacteria bacterium]|mgnify:FL=1
MKLDELVSKNEGVLHSASDGGSGPHAKIQDLETILNVVRKINTSLELSEVLELVTDEAIRIVRADRGFLFLTNAQGELEFVVGRNAHGESIPAQNLQVSKSVLEDVFTTGESLCIENALADHRFERRQSIMELALQTILCSPLQTQDDKIGVMYVDSKHIQAVDKTEILSLFEILAGQAAIAIRNARLYASLKSTYEELKQAHQHIIRSERMAMKGELASEISHELKNLVSIVLLSLQRLQMEIGANSSEELNAIIDKTIAGVRKIEGFSKNLLSHSHSTVRLQPLNLNKVVSDFVEFMKFLPKFKLNRITTELDETIPSINMDLDQIQQVLLNLVNNMVEARADVAIQFATQFDWDGKVALLIVSDNGPGIEPDMLKKLFSEKITTKPEGYGYGLIICKQIIERHGGSIRVESRIGEGARFIMSLPVTLDAL